MDEKYWQSERRVDFIPINRSTSQYQLHSVETQYFIFIDKSLQVYSIRFPFDVYNSHNSPVIAAIRNI